MSYWKEIKNNHIETVFDEVIEGAIYKQISIDAWQSDDDNEEGKVIAKVILTLHGDKCVVYMDNIARTDEYAQEVIQETVSTIQDKYTIWIDDESRDDGTYDIIVYDEYADETDWSLCRGHIATLEQAEEILQSIINNNPQLLFVRLPVRKK